MCQAISGIDTDALPILEIGYSLRRIDLSLEEIGFRYEEMAEASQIYQKESVINARLHGQITVHGSADRFCVQRSKVKQRKVRFCIL